MSQVEDLLDLDNDNVDENCIPQISAAGHQQLNDATKELKIPISSDELVRKVARRLKKKEAAG